MDPIRDKYIFDVDIPRSDELKYKKVPRPLLYAKLASFPICTFFWIRSVGSHGSQMDRSHTLRSFYPYLVGTDSGAKLTPISWSQCAR